jgi:hypothetical protein
MNSERLPKKNAVPLGHPGLTGHMNSQAETASETARPKRQMTEQHRKNLSASLKKMWTRRGGLSSEHRKKISTSVKESWDVLGQMSEEHRRRIAVVNQNLRTRNKVQEVP